MKDLDRYLGGTYRDIFYPDIMTKTLATLPDPDIPKIIHDTGVEHPKTDADMTYLENKSIDKAIRQKLRKKDLYETNINNIYNLFMGQTNEKLLEKASSGSTFQAVKIGQDPILYLMILNNLCFSNQSEQHPIIYLFLETRQLYNTMQHINYNTSNYLIRLRNSQKVNQSCNGNLISMGGPITWD